MTLFDSPELAEAFKHGRTQERLRRAVESLRRIRAIAEDQSRRKSLRWRLEDIASISQITLESLSASTGGVIDDMEPGAGLALASTVSSPFPEAPKEPEGGKYRS